MAKLLSDETMVATWKEFFENHCKSDIETIALSYPEKRSLLINYWDIDKSDSKLTDLLVNQPYKAIFNAEEALKDIDVAVENKLQLHFRVFNLPEIYKLLIRNIRSNHLGMYTVIEGLVKKVTEVCPKLQVAAFQCQKCGAVIKVEQDEDLLKDPSECYEDQGGCGRVSSFKLLTSLSTFIDSQKIEIQDNPEGLRGGQPEKISVYLEDDIVGKIVPGDRVLVNGILHSQQRRKGPFRLTSFNKVMAGNNIECQEMAFEEIEITEEEETEILKISKDPDIYDKMRQSIAPSIYGLDVEKNALVYQLFGGLPKLGSDGTKIRGDIHILFVGDPGTAKSQLLRYMYRLAPRSILASGSASTKAGLTATAIRDEFGDGEWTLEAGALVLANGGLACIDEFDKMRDEDRGGMHEAMEQQEISIAKAGINATLKCKCSILAAANPKQGRFDEFISVHEQINMRPALLSRFDLIFAIKDKPNRETDKELSTHVLNIHHGSEIAENIAKCEKTKHSKKQRDSLMREAIPIFEPEFLRKYVAYAKRKIFPVMTDETKEIIQNYYIDFRAADAESIPFTARQLEGFVRLAEASARVRLSNEVTVEDAKRSISIVNDYLTRVGIDRETGKIDIDIIATGVSHSQQKRMQKLFDIVKRLCEESAEGIASKSDILHEAEIEGIETNQTESALEKMKEYNQIHEPAHGMYRVVL